MTHADVTWTDRPVVQAAALVLPLVLLGLVASRFWLFLLTSILVTGLLARSVGIVFGRARMVSLCQASFAGIGGWVVGYLTLDLGLPFEPALALAGLAAVPVGVLVGLPALRLRGVNLAVVTLGFAMATSVVVFNRGFPGGGTNRAVPRPSIFTDERMYFFFTLLIVVLVELGLRWLDGRRTGVSWKAVGYSERTTAALGLSVPATKLTAFATSAFVAGVAGGLMAGQVGFLSGRSFEPMASLLVFALAVLGGAQFVIGGLLAGVLSVGVPELLRIVGWSQDLAALIFAVGAVQALSQGSGGIAALWRDAVLARRAERSDALPRQRRREAAVFTPRALEAPRGLRAESVSVVYGAVKAVDDVSIELRPGVVHGLVGPNGAGKSSFIDALTGFTASSGDVRLGTGSIASWPAHQRAKAGLRRTFQRERTVPELKLGDYLMLAGGDDLDAAEIDWLLHTLVLPDADTRIAKVDTGGRRRLEIAGAVASHPHVLLLDEPAAGLTDDESGALGAAIRTLAATYGCAILLVEHDIPLVRGTCDIVSILDQGQLLTTGTPDEVFADATVMEAYLGVMPEEPSQ